MASRFDAAAVYGFGPAPQPNNTGMVNPPGQGEPFARTTPRMGASNPTMVLVGVLALALGLIHFSVRLET
jgi:hypothetical protein